MLKCVLHFSGWFFLCLFVLNSCIFWLFHNCSVNPLFKSKIYRRTTLTTCHTCLIFFLVIREEPTLPQIFNFNYKAMSGEKSHYWLHFSSLSFLYVILYRKPFNVRQQWQGLLLLQLQCCYPKLCPATASINKQSLPGVFISILYFLWHKSFYPVSSHL